MAFVHGRLAAFTINSVALSAFCDNLDISVDVDTAETTTFGSLWKTHLPGLVGATIDIGGNFDPTTTTGPASAIYAIIAAGAAVTFVAEPGGTASNQQRGGSCIVTNYKETAGVGDVVKFTMSAVVTGAVTPES